MIKKIFDEYRACFPFEKISNLVYQSLLSCITANSASYKDTFTINEVMEALNVSRTSVIQAVERLEAEGFVKQEKYKGIKICRREEVCVDDMYLARATLEMRAVQVVANRITQREYEKLCGIFQKMKSCAEDGRLTKMLEADEAFHNYLFTCTEEPFLQEAYQQLAAPIRLSRYSAPRSTTVVRTIVDDHKLILNCLKNGNASMAREAMRIHMQSSSENRIFDKKDIFSALRMERASHLLDDAP